MHTPLMSAVLALALNAGGGAPTSESDIMAVVANGTRPDVERVINRIQFLGSPRTLIGQLVHMANGDSPGNPENAIYVLSVLHPPDAGPTFLRLLSSDSAPVRLASCQGLGHLHAPKSAAAAVGERLADPVPAVRRDCAKTLSAWNSGDQGPALAKAFAKEKDPDARVAELEALGHSPGKASIAVLEPVLAGKSETERYAAARSLALLGAPSGRKALEGYLGSLEAGVRGDAVDLLATLPATWTTEDLASRLDDPSANVCIRAAKALAARKDPRGVTQLVLRAERASPDDKFAFESALSELKITQAQRLDIIQKAGAPK